MDQKKEGQFPSTHWTLIARLKNKDAAVALRALDELCAQYHYPLYCYIRCRGLDHHDAQDALHDFLAKLLRLGAFAGAEEQKGRLRALLATALQRFLSNWHRDRAREHECFKDGELNIDAKVAADRYSHEKPRDEDTPDRIFERKWAQELLRLVLKRLGDDYTARGKAALFKKLKPVLLQGGSLRGEGVPALAESLDMKETTLRVANARLLRDYRTILENEVRQTVGSEEEVKAEIDYLRGLFGAG